jgi:hypothetical protein
MPGPYGYPEVGLTGQNPGIKGFGYSDNRCLDRDTRAGSGVIATD